MFVHLSKNTPQNLYLSKLDVNMNHKVCIPLSKTDINNILQSIYLSTSKMDLSQLAM